MPAKYLVYYRCASQRRGIGFGRSFSDYVQLENMYQLNCEIAVNIAGYALIVISVLAVVLIQPHITRPVSSGSDDNLLKQSQTVTMAFS